MDRELLFRKKWIEWVLNFANTDLNSLSESQRERLRKEMLYFSSPLFLESDEQEERFQKKFKDFPIDLSLQKIQEAITPLIEWLIGFDTLLWGECYDLLNLTPYLFIDKYVNGPDRFNMGLAPKDELIKKDTGVEPYWAITNLVNLVKGLPTESFLKCRECGKYFLNLQYREKNYCGLTCYNRHFYKIRMEKIKKNPRKYKAEKKKKALYQKNRYKAITLDKWIPRFKK